MINLTPYIFSFMVDITPSPATDLVGYVTHAVHDSDPLLVAGDFTPQADGSTLKNKGPDTHFLVAANAVGTWYVKIAAYDAFGEDVLNWSSVYSVVISSAESQHVVEDAINSNNVTATGAILLSDNGWIRTGAKQFDGSGNGLLYGQNASHVALFNVGNGMHGSVTPHVSWDGTDLEVTGNIVANSFTGYSNALDGNSYSILTDGDLFFYKKIAGEWVDYKSLRQIETNIARSGDVVTLTNFDRPPTIIVSPRDVMTFNPSAVGTTQRIEVKLAEPGVNDLGDGTYTFTPIALLKTGTITSHATLSYSVSNSGTNALNTPIQTSPVNTTGITVQGILNTYEYTASPSYFKYYRQCSVLVRYRLVGATPWTDGPTVVYTGWKNGKATTYSCSTDTIAAGTYEYQVFYTFARATGNFSVYPTLGNSGVHNYVTATGVDYVAGALSNLDTNGIVNWIAIA